ncbi:hypothetical protein [Paraferrimonas haliotis]|uniref:Uncharacterized protein n=1 Tax=Paraferrimonas haliotis TaxID=2013866 RepID=A0AA37WW18_9GAMM|nr:hypothetical protein [Paraferrimonas haliotis]GLS82817.1 hypothetical protein GCM10007894_07940 [Paraferrimonas haliotis]
MKKLLTLVAITTPGIAMAHEGHGAFGHYHFHASDFLIMAAVGLAIGLGWKLLKK